MKDRRSYNPLPGWLRRTLLGSVWSLLLSGAAWLPLHYLWGSGAGNLPSPLEAWLMRWHGLAVLSGLFAFGAISARHVPQGWRSGRQRTSGLSLCILWAIMAASGYALSYLVSEAWRPLLGWAHAVLGLLAFCLGALHARPIRLPLLYPLERRQPEGADAGVPRDGNEVHPGTATRPWNEGGSGPLQSAFVDRPRATGETPLRLRNKLPGLQGRFSLWERARAALRRGQGPRLGA
ncbi:MAG TPA: hypothetical protein VFG53_04495 [Anaeromyxobacter sp.]|nr:hypothetical protein [Anaeromyxobacter sp.]